jgi:hypothetical protein
MPPWDGVLKADYFSAAADVLSPWLGDVPVPETTGARFVTGALLLIVAMAVLTVVVARSGRALRSLFAGTRGRCHFCHALTPPLAPAQVNRFTCMHCGQYNGFDTDGGYNRPVPGMCEDEDAAASAVGGSCVRTAGTANTGGTAAAAGRWRDSHDCDGHERPARDGVAPGGPAESRPVRLCATCTVQQGMIVDALRDFDGDPGAQYNAVSGRGEEGGQWIFFWILHVIDSYHPKVDPTVLKE